MEALLNFSFSLDVFKLLHLCCNIFKGLGPNVYLIAIVHLCMV